MTIIRKNKNYYNIEILHEFEIFYEMFHNFKFHEISKYYPGVPKRRLNANNVV